MQLAIQIMVSWTTKQLVYRNLSWEVKSYNANNCYHTLEFHQAFDKLLGLFTEYSGYYKAS